jgi:hypothetical protein
MSHTNDRLACERLLPPLKPKLDVARSPDSARFDADRREYPAQIALALILDQINSTMVTPAETIASTASPEHLTLKVRYRHLSFVTTVIWLLHHCLQHIFTKN